MNNHETWGEGIYTHPNFELAFRIEKRLQYIGSIHSRSNRKETIKLLCGLLPKNEGKSDAQIEVELANIKAKTLGRTVKINELKLHRAKAKAKQIYAESFCRQFVEVAKEMLDLEEYMVIRSFADSRVSKNREAQNE